MRRLRFQRGLAIVRAPGASVVRKLFEPQSARRAPCLSGGHAADRLLAARPTALATIAGIEPARHEVATAGGSPRARAAAPDRRGGLRTASTPARPPGPAPRDRRARTRGRRGPQRPRARAA